MEKKKSKVLVLASIIISFFASFCFAQDDVSTYKACKNCGMDRNMFAHSRSLITFDDGTAVPTCSIHCTAVELALSLDKTPRSIEVGDYKTKKLIDAEKAYWVVGGSTPVS